MNIIEVLEQVRKLLQQQGRLSYRILKLQFELDDEYLEALKEELIDIEEWMPCIGMTATSRKPEAMASLRCLARLLPMKTIPSERSTRHCACRKKYAGMRIPSVSRAVLHF